MEKTLEPINKELKKLRARIRFLEGKVFYNSIKKQIEKDLLEKQIQLLGDMDRDTLDLYELKLMLEDTKK